MDSPGTAVPSQLTTVPFQSKHSFTSGASKARVGVMARCEGVMGTMSSRDTCLETLPVALTNPQPQQSFGTAKEKNKGKKYL